MQDARELYKNEVSRLPSSERLRLAALILSELTQEVEASMKSPRVALELLEEMPGSRLFKNSAEADAYLDEERTSWDS
jgi:hypothetical protein